MGRLSQKYDKNVTVSKKTFKYVVNTLVYTMAEKINQSVFETYVSNLMALYGGKPFLVGFKVTPTEKENTVELIHSKVV